MKTIRLTVAASLCLVVSPWTTKSSAAAPAVAQSAVGRPPAPGCDPWDKLKSFLIPTSLDDPPAVLMLDMLTKHVVPAERQFETPVQFSFVYLMHSSWWDALASFNDTASTILPEASLPRQPSTASNNKNVNTVWMFTLLRVTEWFLPAAVPGINATMTKYGLDTSYVTPDKSTMAGIGNFVGSLWVQHGLQDGLNRGGMYEHTHNRRNYSDYTMFVPSNDAYTLKNPTKWQPLIETNDLGYFFVQQHITPQIRNASGFSIKPQDLANFQVEFPYPEDQEETLKLLRKQTDEVLAVSANLTDKQKLQAEYFDDKLISLAPVAFWLALSNQWDLHTLLGATLAMNCVYDATIASWSEKIRHNGVRPVSLVHYFYNDQPVAAYAGQLAGTQSIKGNEWLSYLRTMPHAEYPSGTASVCGAYGAFQKKFLGRPTLSPPVRVFYAKGCSRREPGKTPASEVPFETTDIDAMVKTCGISRLYAGVHFMPAIEAGWKLGEAVGNKCFARYQELANVPPSAAAAAQPAVSG